MEDNDDDLRGKAEFFKSKGNDEYNKKKFSSAIELYTEGIKVKCKDDELQAKLYSNRAIAHFYLGNYQESLSDATAATDLQPTYLKAIERGANACMKMNRLEEAITWCDKGLVIDNKNKRLLEFKMECLEEQNKQRMKEKFQTETVEDTVSTFFYGADEEATRPGYSRFRPGNFTKAIGYYNHCLKSSKEVGDKSGEGNAYFDLGNAFYLQDDFKKAIDNFKLSLKIARELGDKRMEGKAYDNLGIAFFRKGDFQKAIDNYKLYLKIAREAGDKRAEASAYLNIGNAFDGLGDIKKAIESFDLCFTIAKKVDVKRLEGIARNQLGNIYYYRGNLEKARENFSLGLKIAETLSDKSMEVRACNGLGNVFDGLGDFKKGIEYHNLHVTIAKEIGDKSGEGMATGNLGTAFRSLGDFEKALEYQQRYVKIAIEAGDRSGEGKAYGNLGNTFNDVRDFENAIKNLKLCLKIAIELKDKRMEGNTYYNLGCAYYRLGDLRKAKDHFHLNLKFAKEMGSRREEGEAYGSLGSVFQSLGEFDSALYYANLRLEIAKEVKDKAMEARSYYALGRVFESLNRLPIALEQYEISVRSFNNVRSLLESNDEWKINFRNEFPEAFIGLWRVLLKQGKIEQALVAAEEGRAQALTELIKSRYAVQVGPSKLNEENVEEFISLSNSPSSIVFQALHNGSVSFWVLGANGGCIQYRRKLLDDPIALNDVSYFFQSFLKNAYEETGVCSELRCEDRFLDTLRDDPTTTTDETKSVTESFQPPPPQENSLHTLYEFLIEPIADLLQGNELIIAPDGPLWLVPYAALVNHSSNYLCESFKIRLVPSLTILKLIANCPEEPQSKSDVLLVGDPWYEEVVEKKGKKPKPLLKQLPFSRKEVEMIGEILQVTPLTGKQAAKSEVLARLGSAALVHIAAHGNMEAGEIALTPNPDRTSKIPKKEDYILTMADVLGVRLRARLVVLSCCHSAKGKIKAEGVVGIARAFLGAGAHSVLMSLWAINDEATMEFMANFYHHLVEGESANQSLNQAMKRFRESDEYSSVKHWAPFVLVGDDVTLEFGEEK